MTAPTGNSEAHTHHLNNVENTFIKSFIIYMFTQIIAYIKKTKNCIVELITGVTQCIFKERCSLKSCRASRTAVIDALGVENIQSRTISKLFLRATRGGLHHRFVV